MKNISTAFIKQIPTLIQTKTTSAENLVSDVSSSASIIQETQSNLYKLFAQLNVMKSMGVKPNRQRELELEISRIVESMFGDSIGNFDRIPSTYNFLPSKLLTEEPLSLTRNELSGLLYPKKNLKSSITKKIDGNGTLNLTIGRSIKSPGVSYLQYFKKGATEPWAKQLIMFEPQKGVLPAAIVQKEIVDGKKSVNLIQGQLINSL